MSLNKSFVIAYSIDNIGTANQIVNDLKPAGIEFNHIVGVNTSKATSLFEEITTTTGPCLLLITDNFLKSGNCLLNSFALLQKLVNEKRVLPIIADGKYKIEDSEEFRGVPTSFDRISHVIQYMNYWQDQYLEMRKLKRKISSNEEPEFSENLKVIRDISSEIGEFLRILKNTERVTLNEFSENNYSYFYNKYDLLELSHAENVENVEKKVHKSNARSLDEVIAKTDQQIIDQQIIEATFLNDNQISDEVSTDEIPGMDMLAKAAAPIASGITINNIVSKKPVENENENEKIEEDENTLENLLGKNNMSKKKEEGKVDEEKALLEKLIRYKKGGNSGLPLIEDFDLISSKKEGASSSKNSDDDEKITKEEENQYQKHQVNKLDDQDDEDEMDEDEIDLFDDEDSNLESEIDGSNPIQPKFDLGFMDDDKKMDLEPNEQFIENFKEELSAETDVPPLSDMEQIMHEASHQVLNGEVEKGLAILKYSLERKPKNISLRYQYAIYLADYANNSDAAAVQLEKLLKYDKKNENAYMRLAKIAEMNQDYLLAKNYYEKVAQLNPNYPGIHYHLGLITSAHSGDNSKQAIKYFKKAVKKDKYNAETHYRYARALVLDPKNKDKAIKHLKKTIELEPYHPMAYQDLIKFYTEAGDHAKVEKYKKTALSYSPDFLDNEPSAINEELVKPEKEVRTKSEDHSILKTNANSDKVICITGATSGIGKATAEVFAKNGYRLILTGRRYDRLNELKSTFEENHDSQVIVLPFDVRDLESINNAVEKLQDDWANVDILINNAGLAKGYAPIHEGDLEHWDNMIDTNIKGLLYMTRAISPLMVKNRKGHIINICSTAGQEVYPNGNVYCATKFAVDAITKSTRLDLHKFGIRVSQVSPGHVEETEFAMVRFDGNKKKAKVYEDFNPLTSKDVAESIYFIASQPPHVNIQDILMMGTQQAGNNHIDRSGRKFDEVADEE